MLFTWEQIRNVLSRNQIYLKLYFWLFMLITPHEIFYHSSDIIRTCILPIGQLSEEAWEVRNKHRR